MNKPSTLKTITILIPAYNEESTIKKTIEAVKASDTLGLRKEILIVDDFSTDQTAAVLKKIDGIKVLTHQKNQGKGAAIRTGFKEASGDIVLIQDADMEYSPSDFPKLLEPFMIYGAQVVYGSRFRGSEARRVIYFTHHYANQVLTFFSNVLTNLNLTDMECGYKVFTKDVVAVLKDKLESNRFGIEPEITARIAKLKNLKIYEVGISYQGRTYEEGKKIGFKDGLKALYEITYYNLFVQ